jgi:hypothetical protein
MKGDRRMSLEDDIRNVLFDLGKNIKILKIDDDNMIFSIDYDIYVEKLKSILGHTTSTPETLE